MRVRTSSSCTATTSSSYGGRSLARYAGTMTNGDLATQGAAVKRAATALAQASDESRAAVLRQVADQLEECRKETWTKRLFKKKEGE